MEAIIFNQKKTWQRIILDVQHLVIQKIVEM
jgi:hypothetical protein